MLLVVDDDEGVRQSLRVIFQGEWEVLLAQDGESALDLVRELRVVVAVVDIRMIGMSGIELLRVLKERDPRVEVIILTGNETVGTAQQALRLGACDYLTKPCAVEDLREAVARAVERREMMTRLKADTERLLSLSAELQSRRVEDSVADSRGEVYASIVHDINSPLTTLCSFVDTVNQRLAGTEHLEGAQLEQIRERLGLVGQQVNRCIDISRRYLSFLRQQAVESVETGVNRVLGEVGDMLELHPSLGTHSLVIAPLAVEAQVAMHATDLTQVLWNLAVNGLQCSPGSHQVEIRPELLKAGYRDFVIPADGPNDIYRGFESLGDRPVLRVRVADDGPGMTSETLSKLFTPYFTTKAVGEGTGLGLAIVMRLVRRASGAIHVWSARGEGSSFTVYLPLVS